jgi:AmmeMemoRadiSam system protein B
VRLPEIVIILGVNHHGIGHPFAVDGHQRWRTPLGEINVAVDLREELLGLSEIFTEDSIAGSQEHSLEVQVPFVQYIKPDAKILPIILGSTNGEQLIAAGEDLAKLCARHDNILILSSTDMSHYINAETAQTRDQLAIDQILKRDPMGLYETVRSHRISMCGVSPTVMLLAAVNKLGATEVEIVDYTNSGHTSGNFDEVVAYLSMIIY